jgi:hypothetical protein
VAFLSAGTPDAEETLSGALTFGRRPAALQDLEYSIRQLVEIAVRPVRRHVPHDPPERGRLGPRSGADARRAHPRRRGGAADRSCGRALPPCGSRDRRRPTRRGGTRPTAATWKTVTGGSAPLRRSPASRPRDGGTASQDPRRTTSPTGTPPAPLVGQESSTSTAIPRNRTSLRGSTRSDRRPSMASGAAPGKPTAHDVSPGSGHDRRMERAADQRWAGRAGANRRTRAPAAMQASEPSSTPTLVSASNSGRCAKASRPMNRLIVKPTPHSRATP